VVELGGKLGSGVAVLLFRFDGYFWRKFQQQKEMFPVLLPIKVLRWINSAGQNALQRQNRGVRAAPHPEQSVEKFNARHSIDSTNTNQKIRPGWGVLKSRDSGTPEVMLCGHPLPGQEIS
jgi:hypothetical protein